MSLQTILLTLASIAVFVICCSASVFGVEFTFQPALTMSEEYNDNLFLTTTDRKGEYITRVVPSIWWKYSALLWDWDVAYAYDYRSYAKYRLDQNLYTLNLNNHTRLLGDLLQLEVSDVHTRTPLSLVRDWTQESPFLNQTEVNTLTVTPFIKMRPSPLSSITTGYWYRNTGYQDPLAIDKSEQSVYASGISELSSRLTASAGIRYSATKAEQDHLRMRDVSAGVAYAYALDSTAWFTISESWFDFGQAGETSQVGWDAGFIRKSGRYSYSLSTKLTYLEDPLYIVQREDRYVAAINRETDRTSLGFSAGWYGYRNIVSKRLENTRQALSGTLSHAATQSARIIFDLSLGRIENAALDQDTDLYLGGVRIEYIPTALTTASLQYSSAHVSSPAVDASNYSNSRVLAEIKITF